MARVHGIAIAPGVSRNGRLYTRENLARAHKRLAARIEEGVRPVIMRTHHDAGDDSLRIAARVNAVSLTSDGAIAYEGTTVETAAGKDIAALVESASEPTPVLAHVSIHGNWIGEPQKVMLNGSLVETADDLEIDKIDFTATPGVLTATARSESFTPSNDPSVISETMRPVQLFADSLSEAYLGDQEARATVSISAYLGGYDLSICAWGVPPEDLDACADTARAAITAALTALGSPTGTTETHQTAAAPVAENTKEAPMGTETAAPAAETAAPEAATQVEETTEPTLGDVLKAITALTVALTPAAPAAETATPNTETVAETAPAGETAPADAALRESIKNEILGELVVAGVVKPTRKGRGLTETTEAKAEAADAWENRGENLAAAFGAIAPAEAATPVEA